MKSERFPCSTPVFFRRILILLIFLLICAVVVTVKLIRIAAFDREELLKRAVRTAAVEDLFYPPRGKITDSDGVVLAWSERYYDLVLTRKVDDELSYEKLCSKVLALLPEAELPAAPVIEQRYTVVSSLKLAELNSAKELQNEFSDLRVQARIERRQVPIPELHGLLGTVELYNGRPTGVSGLEHTYDEQLAGKPGRYRVLLDRNRNWLPNSWRYLAHPVPGEDVRLSLSLEALRKLAGATGEEEP